MKSESGKQEISALGKIWKQKHAREDLAFEISRQLQVSDILARLISTRIETVAEANLYINPKIKDSLPDPFHLKDMEKAVDRLILAIKNNEKICIFADYDVDGATSSALIKNILAQLGVNASIYVPDRIIEGYGPTPEAMQKIKRAGNNLIITVDCGSVAFDAIKEASRVSLDAIIIDHHISLDILPEAIAVVNPNRLDEQSDCKNLAAVGVSFLYMVALVSTLRKQEYFKKNNRKEPNLMQQLDIVALGTVCDVMQLTGLNRALVSQGIKIARKRANIGYRALCDVAGLEEAINCYHLGFVIGPRINAGGRVGKANLGASLLSTSCPVEAEKYANELDIHNNDRRAIELAILEEAMSIAEKQADQSLLFVECPGAHPGVIGIVAGRLKEKYNKPVAVLSINDDGIAKASCRSVKGVDFGSALLRAKDKGMLIAGGGHSMAAGFTAALEKLPSLRDFLNAEFEAILKSSTQHLVSYYDEVLATKGANIKLLDEISVMEPFGNGNPSPVFRFDNMYVLKADIVGGKHIKVVFAPSYKAHKSGSLNGIYFNGIGTEIAEILFSKKPYNLSVIGNLKVNKWQNMETLQLMLQDVIVT